MASTQITISSITPTLAVGQTLRVEYKLKGANTSFKLIPTAYNALPIVFIPTDTGDNPYPEGTLFDINIWRVCSPTDASSKLLVTTSCICASGFTTNAAGNGCEKITNLATTSTGGVRLCLAASQNQKYTQYGTRVYKAGFTIDRLFTPIETTGSEIEGTMVVGPWINPASSFQAGPMNESGVWVDTNCDGVKDEMGSGVTTISSTQGSGYTTGPAITDVPFTGPIVGGTYRGTGATGTVVIVPGAGTPPNNGVVQLVNEQLKGKGYKVGDILTIPSGALGFPTTPAVFTVGAVEVLRTTISSKLVNAGLERTVYVGVGGDSEIELYVNGDEIVNTYDYPQHADPINNEFQYKIWHIVPVTFRVGTNYFNFVGTGTGTTNNAMAMVVYDNTAAQIMNATTATLYSQLNRLFDSKNLRSVLGAQDYNMAVCPIGQSLDISGGVGAYKCVLVETDNCNP